MGSAKDVKREPLRPAVFLDRDGTINEEVGYLDRLEKLQLIPGAAEAIRLLNDHGLAAIVITNQSGIARGFFDEPFVVRTHQRLQEMLNRQGARIDAFYLCPHHPTSGEGVYRKTCDCRKPAPGLLLQGARDWGADLSHSYMIGDTAKDIEAGRRAGTRTILVRTGLGCETELLLEAEGDHRGQPPARAERPCCQEELIVVRPSHVATDLLAAVQWLLQDWKA